MAIAAFTMDPSQYLSYFKLYYWSYQTQTGETHNVQQTKKQLFKSRPIYVYGRHKYMYSAVNVNCQYYTWRLQRLC